MNNEEKILEILAIIHGEVSEVRKEVSGLKAYVESSVEKKIGLLAEGHKMLGEKIDALQLAVSELHEHQDNMELTVRLHERKLSAAK